MKLKKKKQTTIHFHLKSFFKVSFAEINNDCKKEL